MPRNVRNFWIEATIDGRASEFSGGPRSKDGGFSLTVYQRLNGAVIQALKVETIVGRDGKLILHCYPSIRDDNGNSIPLGVSAERPMIKASHYHPEDGFTIETVR